MSQNSGFRISKEYSDPFWILTTGFWILVSHEESGYFVMDNLEIGGAVLISFRMRLP